jgi:hypothetical protein
MLGQKLPFGRQIHHLPPFYNPGGYLIQILVAELATRNPIWLDLLGIDLEREMMSLVALLYEKSTDRM